MLRLKVAWGLPHILVGHWFTKWITECLQTNEQQSKYRCKFTCRTERKKNLSYLTVKQGSVSESLLCSALTAEFTTENNDGGMRISAISTIRSLAYVDDIANISLDHEDAHKTHENMLWFSQKIRLVVNARKCHIMTLNVGYDIFLIGSKCSLRPLRDNFRPAPYF